MSIEGKRRAEQKTKLPEDGGMFGPMNSKEQQERRAAQAFCKMLGKSPNRYKAGWVNWVEARARVECGDLFSLVENRLEKRRKLNKKYWDSVKANQQAQKEGK